MIKSLIKKTFAWGFSHQDFILGIGIGFIAGMILGALVYT